MSVNTVFRTIGGTGVTPQQRTGTGQNGRDFMWDDIALLVPEPASVALLGLAGLALLRRRQRG